MPQFMTKVSESSCFQLSVCVCLSACSNCKPCPGLKPTFLCGNDNRTYSSLCRLDYHNCIHSTAIRIACKGFCPCKGKSTPETLALNGGVERELFPHHPHPIQQVRTISVAILPPFRGASFNNLPDIFSLSS